MRNLMTAFVAAVLAAGCAAPGGADVDPGPFSELLVQGELAPQGIFDPSIEYAPDGTGWLAYSAVKAGRRGTVETGIARSSDGGRTWVHVAKVNNAAPASARLPKEGNVDGVWWHEVSTLAYDPGDSGREWKLFWHRYLARRPYRGDHDRMFAVGWIAMKTAPSPQGPWSEETPLIGAGPFPYGLSNTAFKIQSLGPDFAPYIVLTEPGAFVRGGTLYLALQAFRKPVAGQQHRHDIVLIASDDHGRSWRGIGRVLAAEQAASYDARWFTGPALAEQDGRLFLLVTPETAGPKTDDHKGTIIFEFSDLDRGILKSGADGAPLTIRQFAPSFGKGGQADFHERHPGGIVVPQVDLRNLPRAFRIFETGLRILD